MTEDALPTAAELTPVQWLGRLVSVAFQPGTVAHLEHLPGQELTHVWVWSTLHVPLHEPKAATSTGWCLRVPGQWRRSARRRKPGEAESPVQVLPSPGDTSTEGSTAEGEMVLHLDAQPDWLPLLVLLAGGIVDVPTALATEGGLLFVADQLERGSTAPAPLLAEVMNLSLGPEERAALQAAAATLREHHHRTQAAQGAAVRLTRPLLRQPPPNLQHGAVEVAPGAFYSGPAVDFVEGLLGAQPDMAEAMLSTLAAKQRGLAERLHDVDPEGAERALRVAELAVALLDERRAGAVPSGPPQVVLQPAGDPFHTPPRVPAPGDPSGLTAQAPNNPVTATHMEAVLAGGPNWQQKGGWDERGGRVLFRHESQRGNRVDVQYEPPEWEEEPPENALQVQQDRIARLSLFEADVMLALLVLIADSPERDKGTVVTTDRLLAMKGLQRLTREDRGQRERKLYAAMDTLRSLSYSARVSFRGKHEVLQVDGDRLLNIVRCTREEQAQLFAGEWVETDRAWRVRPGQWASRLLAPNRQGGSFHWVAQLAQRALELSDSPHRATADLAKRIYYSKFLLSGSITPVNQPAYFTVERLLTEIYQPPPPVESRSRDWGRRTRDTLESALNLMVDLRLLGQWAYTDETDEPPVRGWVDRWLKRRLRLVSIEAHAKAQGLNPVPAHAQLQEAVTRPNSAAPGAKRRGRKAGQPKRIATRRRRPKEPVSAVATLDAVAVRQKLAALHWTQRTLAQHLRFSPSALSQYLSQTRTPSADVAARVQRWLDTPNEDLGGLPE